MRFHVWILTLSMLFGSAGICVSEFSEANNTGGTDSGRSSVYTEYGAWKYTGQTRACRHGDPSRRDQEEEAEEYGILAVRLHFLPGSSDGDRVGVYVLRNNRNYSGAMDFSGKLCYNSSSIYKSRKRKQKRRGDSCDSNAYD